MAKIPLNEQLDRALDAVLARRYTSLASVSAQIRPLVRIAAELVNLPSESFRMRLKAKLQRRASMATPAVKPIREGFHTITPYLIIPHAEELIAFVKEAFGAEEIFRVKRPDTGQIMHAEVRIGDSMLELADATPECPPMPCTLHLYMPDTDALYERAMRAGATSLREPKDEPYGDRSSGVQDPFGNRWFIATHIRDVKF